MNGRAHLRPKERGSAAVLSLLALLIVTTLAGMLIAGARTEMQMSGHHQRHTQALYNAEAGYAEALARVSAGDSASYYAGPQQSWQTEPGWGRYIVQQTGASADDPNYMDSCSDGLDNDGDNTVDETDEHYPEILSSQGGIGIGYPWVKMRYKFDAGGQVVLYGDHDRDIATPPCENLVRGNPVLVVSSRGLQGSARRTVEVEGVRMPVEVPYTATYSESDDFSFNGTQFLISGRDWDPYIGAVIPGNPEVPGIVTTGNPGVIAGGLNFAQQNNVEGAGGEPSVTASPVDMDLQAIVDLYAGMAEHTLPTGNYTNVTWGGLDDYTIMHCTGDIDLAGANTGGGVLLVQGDFSCTGQFTWYGLVVVMGCISFTGGGAGVHIYGCVLSEGGINQQVLSGNSDIMYSSIALNQIANMFPYVVVSWRET